MYQCILLFQISCIFITGICLYLAAADKGLKNRPYGMSFFAVLLGIFIMETGYGLYLQETAMAGLQTAEKVCLLGKLLAADAFFVMCISLSEKEKSAPLFFLKAFGGAAGLAVSVFIFGERFRKLLFLEQRFCQNQFFYYIESELTDMGKAGLLFLQGLPLAGILWLAFGKKNKLLSEKFLLLASALFLLLSIVCKNQPLFRHYDTAMPLAAGFSVCMVIFMAWNDQKVYTL